MRRSGIGRRAVRARVLASGRQVMRSIIRAFLLTFLATMAMGRPASAQVLRVVTTTADLGSLARDVGGDKVTVVALARGYQDPHFVDPKPSFILEVSRANLLIVI